MALNPSIIAVQISSVGSLSQASSKQQAKSKINIATLEDAKATLAAFSFNTNRDEVATINKELETNNDELATNNGVVNNNNNNQTTSLNGWQTSQISHSSSTNEKRAPAATVTVESGETSLTFSNKVCGDSTVSSLTVTGSSNQDVAWPSCTASFPNLVFLSASAIRAPPVLDYLPLSITGIELSNQYQVAFAAEDVWNRYKSNLATLTIMNSPKLGPILPGTSYGLNDPPTEIFSKLSVYSVHDSGFNGTLPVSFFKMMPNAGQIIIERNNLQGDIPATGNVMLSAFRASGNNFTSWSSSSFTNAAYPSSLSHIDLSSNLYLTRFFDDEWLQKLPLTFVNLNSLPSYIGGSQISTSSSSEWKQINMPSFFSPQMINPASSTATKTMQLSTLLLANTPVFGPLPAWPLSSTLPIIPSFATNFNYDFSSSLAYGPLPLVWQNASFASLALNNLRNLSGSLLNWHIKSNTTLQTLSLRNTSLTGPMIDLNLYPALTSLKLDGTQLDYCSAEFEPRITPTSTSGTTLTCVLDETACPCLSSLYPLCSTNVNCSEWVPPINTPPINAPNPPTSNTPPPTPSPSSCPYPAPSSYFSCINGTWSYVGSVEEPTLVISPNSPIVISGNLSISDAITFKGINSSIIVSQCVNATLIEIELTIQDVEEIFSKEGHQLTILLLSSGSSSCASDLSQVQVSLNRDSDDLKGSCKRVSVRSSSSSSPSSGSSLSAIFTINKDKCNTWWIILASVIAGVVVIGVLVIALLAVFVPSFRAVIRPYSAARGTSPKLDM